MEYVKHTLYINLDHRTDRKIHIEQQLQSVGITAERFNAVKTKHGAIGCSISHLKCLELAKRNNWEHVMIIEDDILFLNPTQFIENFNKFIKSNRDFDVVLLAGNNIPPYERTADYCVKVRTCQTTTGYIVKNHYFDKMIQNIREGVQQLIVEPENRKMFAIDRYWFKLQMQDNWYLITPLTITQREDYSDIENRRINYNSMMTDLDKARFFANRK
jgi:GR25 family glycosyltransferase involved in LPS biosynthesis